MFNSGVQRPSASSLQERRVCKRICVYDCRFANKEITGKWLETSRLDFNGFLHILQQEFKIHPHETYVLATTDRTVLDFDRFEELPNSSTIYLLQHENQALSVSTQEHIKFTPHYDTLIQSGIYEYYASEGQNPLPYALAELIDNALSATAKNTGMRTIEIRMLFDETLGKPAVIVLDNGCGMTSKQLKNWAVYRLSKFNREDSTFASKQDGYVRPKPVRRSLNSDISYFGVGGKQAVFYIGDSTRMISKSVGSPDVHELVLSQEGFERRERNQEDVYSEIITNRKPGDSSHVNKDDEHFLHALIAEEFGKESFTAVVITGVLPEHITFLKQDFEVWTRQLAHIYHYYIHGVSGNDLRSSSMKSDYLPKIDIQITLREKPPRCPRAMNLKEVDDDMQTLYISNAAETFEFNASIEQDGGTVEGVIRYHPFLYDKETYPKDPYAVQASSDNGDDDNDNEPGVLHEARGKRSIFDCFWNGRLIPYTTVSEFEWCSWKTRIKVAEVPEECYSRFSGVLFTDDRFQVSTNKLTFMDLELKLKNKNTIFTCVVNGQEKSSEVTSLPDQVSKSVTGRKDQSKTTGLQLHPSPIKKQRSNIQKEFTQWLKNCHEKWDKKVKFLGYKETITRTDVPTKKMQQPWATFSSIEWDGKIYRKGQLVKSQKTVPILYGTVVRFLLYGDYKGDVFASGGQVEVALEPKALYNKTKTIAISKIDKTATDEAIKKNIDNDSEKLPEKLKVDWPDGNPWPQNAVRPAGTPLGSLKIEIVNKKGESLSRMPAGEKGTVIKLNIELTVVQHGPKEDQQLITCVAQHSAKWGFWFKKIETLTNLGKYTLSLNTVINESNATVFGGRKLPSYELKFTIKEGSAESFVISAVSSTLRVGVPFDIPLLIKDGYDHSAMPPPNLTPVLKCSGLDLSYEKVEISGTMFTIRSVKARGKVLNYQQSKTYDLKVTLPGLKTDTQTLKISLLPGHPHSIHVTPEDNPLTLVNGNPAKFNVEIHDEAGNITAHPKQTIRCQVQGLAPVSTDCSSTGAVQLVTKPINLKIIKGEPQMLNVQFEMPSQKNIALVTRELKVLPSRRVSWMQLCSDGKLVLRNNEKIEWLAGGLLENLFYKLYDEADRAVPLTAEIASSIKVNWRTTEDVNLEDLVQGKLPDVQVPTQVHEERFYQVSYQDQSVSVSFNIVPRPDEPTRLKATLPQNTVKLGETLPGNINLELVDQYDNVTKTLTSACVNHMTVEAEGLDKSTIAFLWQESSSSVLVTGIRFQSGTPGSREMCFTYTSYVERVIIKVTAGVPAQLKLVSEPEKPLQVLNDRGITTPFIIQLCDKWGNPSPDQRVVVELTSSPPTLKVTTAVISQPVNAEGKASFTVNSVSGPKGYYQLEFKGSFNKKPIPGPSVNLTVIPDPNKPVSLSVEYDTNAKFPAGGKFPVFSVTVVSDVGSPIKNFNPAAVSMLLWKGVPSGKTPPQTAIELKCSKPMENEKKHCFHFRDKEIPEHVGKHTIQFSLCTAKKFLFSNQITVNVVANQPVKLGPDSQPPTPVVSYSKAIANRTLVENMTLRIMDSYGNPAGQDLDGKLVVSIMNSSGNSNKNLPLFEGKVKGFQFSLVEGKAHITRLAIMENSPGENGSSYILLFKPEVSMVATPLAPFELPFHFYNDAENQRTMFERSKKKDELTAAVAAYKEIFTTYGTLLQLMTSQHMDASRKEVIHRNELNKRNVKIAPTASIPDIDRLLTEKTAEADTFRTMPRRVCSIRDHFSGQQDVLGMVGHLAFVQDDAAARVISWHIRGDMDCVITKTTAAARRIYDDTQGRQQVMALDSVYVPLGNRPLPHIRNGLMLFDPPGNPVYARELLIYPQDQESCDIAFKNILGDTILIDDLDSANNYRRAVVQNKSQCPTILTRQGDRISAKGKFGGAQNKAPPMNTLQVFGAPLPQPYYTLKDQIDLLNQYRSVLEKRDKAAKNREDHLKNMKSPDMLKKQQEMEEKMKQLEEIERQLVSTPVRPVKRGPGDAGEPSGFIPKRAKQ
ncbi:structural maintenance of chromosomes flexible hinge domain-containing protein 1 isoform X2 [Siniperca chuatsi]|uniref:structural maintenance of chromosomes flexible hinge domain-containing protein 1 isoform X2 n=1 Tax=Siniperca chuatsi TaxID=119488 RepID=UPI001CE0C469|nr:structural maintenance of chromosomes flexible hinge domain-containing protein 1 isoform X2 [Siniperca chuatsi]